MTHLRRLAVALALIVVGAVLGYHLPGRQTTPSGPGVDPTPTPPGAQVYTCSMHPQVRLDRPGPCPICQMPLVPVSSPTGADDGLVTIELSAHAAAMARVETAVVERRPLTRDLALVGKVEFNEAALATITPRVDGYVERLFVNFTGVAIRKGDHLAEVYSPELLVAQQELLIALGSGIDSPLVATAKTKLKLLGLTASQVANLIEKNEIAERITLYSPISGTVIERFVVDQAAFKAGEPLYRIADLSTVWVYVDVYEYDLPWIRYGQRVSIAAEALPSTVFTGMVTFVEPVVNELTRTIRVPVHVQNVGHRLKPGMFVSVDVHAALGSDGLASPTGVEGKHTCPMHPQVVEQAGGDCPFCGMPLELIPGRPGAPAHPEHGAAAVYRCPMQCEGEKTYDRPGKCPVCHMALAVVEPTSTAHGPLAIPVTAVLDSGTRKLVYVEPSPGVYQARNVTLGPRAGEYYPVVDGLVEGERVVVRGNFLIDSQFQINGESSLLYPGGLHASMGHQHGGSEKTAPPPTTPNGSDKHAGHGR